MSARAFLEYVRYVSEREEREETYRIYVSECLRGLTGISIGYMELVSHEATADFNAQEVAMDVIQRAGLEVTD